MEFMLVTCLVHVKWLIMHIIIQKRRRGEERSVDVCFWLEN